MFDSKRPGSGRFVVRPAKSAEAERRLAALGTLSPVRGRDLAILEIEKSEHSPKDLWRHLTERAGPALALDPVLVDEQGAEHFPTGDLVVRFVAPPSDEELERFADAFELRIVGRNERVASQVRFERQGGERRYLLDLLEALGEAAEVRAAWASTVAAFHRADGGR